MMGATAASSAPALITDRSAEAATAPAHKETRRAQRLINGTIMTHLPDGGLRKADDSRRSGIGHRDPVASAGLGRIERRVGSAEECLAALVVVHGTALEDCVGFTS